MHACTHTQTCAHKHTHTQVEFETAAIKMVVTPIPLNKFYKAIVMYTQLRIGAMIFNFLPWPTFKVNF